MIDGSQCTIAWYVDDNKISHKDPAVVLRMIAEIESSFGKMTVTRGRKQVFLGMNIEYTDKKTAIITMKEYLTEAISKLEMGIGRATAPTQASKKLFEVDEKLPLSPKREGEIFHSVAAKLL